jgi:ABC-type polysaccharide/polyol phosphate transport system ATPase subunit
LASAPFIASLVSFFETYIRTPPVETVIVKTGRCVLFDEYARRAIQRFIRGLGRATKDGLWLLPNVQLSRAHEARNVILVGTQGSGKTLV